MNDCISRKEVIETIEWYDKNVYYIECLNDIIEYIKKMPSVTPQYTEAEIQKIQELEQAQLEKAYEIGKAEQTETGRWGDTDEWRETVDGFEQWGYFRKCSKCGYVFKFLEIDNYCPNCGADMRGKEFIEGLNKDGDRAEESMVD